MFVPWQQIVLAFEDALCGNACSNSTMRPVSRFQPLLCNEATCGQLKTDEILGGYKGELLDHIYVYIYITHTYVYVYVYVYIYICIYI